MRCRNCPYGIEDFTLRTEMYKSVYGEYHDDIIYEIVSS